ncbi:MAG: amidohydrolase family protein [Chloroflexota bacterium]|nr:amidohydrolase family protein [Chloroflexota bacterium]
MIVDAHMHVGHESLISEDMLGFVKSKGLWREMHHRLSPEGVVEALDEAEIDQGVIFPLTFSPPDRPWQVLNDMTATYIQAYPDRLIGFAVVNPREVAQSLAELERAVDELGLRGIKLHPSMQEFYPNDESFFPVYEFAQARGIPVLCHTGASAASHPDKYSHPLLLDEVAVRFPELYLILAHAGRPMYAEAALLLRKHSHVYADLCANVGRRDGEALLAFVLLALKVYAGATDRLLFGSDYPVFWPADFLGQIRAAVGGGLAQRLGLQTISEGELVMILGDNVLSILNAFDGGRETCK